MSGTALVGVDIGTSAVRAAEIDWRGGHAVLRRFGQVALPVGAVIDGEVSDPAVVGSALRRLWSEAGFSVRQVCLGVTSQRVIVRQAELAEMTDGELESALRFEAQELIPIPVDDAVLGVCILERGLPPDEEGGVGRMRILLAAAQRDVVRGHLAAARAGGLDAVAIDPTSLALTRAVPYEPSRAGVPTGSRPGGALSGPLPGLVEAIVGVGAALTTIVVREDGIPRFVRILSLGGRDVTKAIAESLECPAEVAEGLKRRSVAGAHGTALTDRTRAVTQAATGPLVEEIRGSIDFYLAQADVERVDRILLCGGPARDGQLTADLRRSLGQLVEVPDGRALVPSDRTGLSSEQWDLASDLLLPPLGLALWGAPSPAGPRISLLPAEVVAARQQRRLALRAGATVAGLALALGAVWGVRGRQVDAARRGAAADEGRVGMLGRQVADLSDVTNLQDDVRRRQALAATALAHDVDWVRLLGQMAAVMPSDTTLTAFAGQRPTGTTATGGPAPEGTVTVSGVAASPESLAAWVRAVSSLPALSGVWVSSAARGSTPGASGGVSFTASANVTRSAGSANRAATGGSR